MKVIKNTFPIDLKPGDRVKWVRKKRNWVLCKDEVKVFATADCDESGKTKAGKIVPLVGVVGENKKEGWILILDVGEKE